MEYKKRDRTGEIYHDWTVIGPGKENRTWIMRCKCGREKTAFAERMYSSKRCGSCSKKKDNKKLGKFLAANNTLVPKKYVLDPEEVYEFEHHKFLYPLRGVPLKEYKKTACFEVIDCNKADLNTLKVLNGRVVVRKSLAEKFR